MNVLVRAARGRRLGEPLRPLPVPPEHPARGGPYETHFLPDAVRAVPV